MPKVQMTLCSNVDLPDDNNMMGINVILGAAEGEIVTDPDVQRAALHVIITCVCAPIYRVYELFVLVFLVMLLSLQS